jgi:hypothetical protein
MATRNFKTSSIKNGITVGGRTTFWDQISVFSSSSFESIQTVTVGSGGQATVEFTSIPATYAHLQVRAIFKETYNTGTDVDNLNVRFNSDSTTSYIRHALVGDGASLYHEGYTGQTLGAIAITPRNTSASHYGTMVLDILDYANTNKRKTIRSHNGVDKNGSGQVRLSSVLWNKTDAITSITFTGDSSGFQQYSRFALYGIKVAS